MTPGGAQRVAHDAGQSRSGIEEEGGAAMDVANRSWRKVVYSALLLLAVALGTVEVRAACTVQFTDSGGSPIVLPERPERVVSLAPGITGIVFALGAGEAIKGLTWHDTFPPETAQKDVVGGLSSPSLERIEALKPDVVFLSSLHREVRERFTGGTCHAT